MARGGEAIGFVERHSALGFERHRAGVAGFAQQQNTAGDVDDTLSERNAAAALVKVLRVEVDDARDDTAQCRDLDSFARVRLGGCVSSG